jgi:dihydrofolate reductase
MGHPIIMGRKTFESIGQILKGRTNIILTTKRNYSLTQSSCIIANHVNDIIRKYQHDNDVELFVIGGAEIYKQFLPLSKHLYITEIDKDYTGDTFFPTIDKNDFVEISRESVINSDVPFAFVKYERINHRAINHQTTTQLVTR